MKSTLSIIAATALLAATNVAALDRTLQGCFASTTGMVFNSTIQYNSRGSCGDACYAMDYPVMAMTNASYCYCSQTLPPASTKVDNSKCSIPCPGFGAEICGARGYLSVYITGMTPDVANAAPVAADSASPSSSASTANPTAKPSVVTVGGQTVVVTADSSKQTSASSSPSSSSSGGGGPSKAGIAAGIVVGVLVISAILGGLFLFMRNRKRREIEDEYKRNAAVSSFISNGKPQSSAGNSSFTDMRLDPAVMAQRRMSDGSIADNQDYSRRILKVTNA